MKIISVHMDDYDRPLIGTLVVNDDDTETTEKLTSLAATRPGLFLVETHTLTSVLAEMRYMDRGRRRRAIRTTW